MKMILSSIVASLRQWLFAMAVEILVSFSIMKIRKMILSSVGASFRQWLFTMAIEILVSLQNGNNDPTSLSSESSKNANETKNIFFFKFNLQFEFFLNYNYWIFSK